MHLHNVRVCFIARRIDHYNPISGHYWWEHGPITGYAVYGPFGFISKHKSEAKAEQIREEWQDFYDKYPVKY